MIDLVDYFVPVQKAQCTCTLLLCTVGAKIDGLSTAMIPEMTFKPGTNLMFLARKKTFTQFCTSA